MGLRNDEKWIVGAIVFRAPRERFEAIRNSMESMHDVQVIKAQSTEHGRLWISRKDWPGSGELEGFS